MAELCLALRIILAGHQAAAQHHCERGSCTLVKNGTAGASISSASDHRRALTALASCPVWLRGLPVRAVKTAWEAVDEAMSRGHPVDLASALHIATPVFLWAGDFETAADLVDRTIAQS